MAIECYVVKKGKKFMEGHSYSNIRHIGYRFNWTNDENNARVLNKQLAFHFAQISGGKVFLYSGESRS